MTSKNKIDQKSTDSYSFGYKKGVLDYLTYRAQKSFDFILPHLKPEMEVLECGCGPGVVTFEIAKEVINGIVIGIDIDEDQINTNNLKVSESSFKNLKFEVANILELPYPDNFFDIVYIQALIVHIKSPISSIREVYRVLKKDGIIALREPIMDKTIFSPEEPILLESFELIQKAINSYGGDASIGRKLLPLLKEVGFKNIQISASWEQPDSLDQWPAFYEGWLNVFTGGIGDIILDEGWCDKKHINKMVKSWKRLGKEKNGFAASPWGEAVGLK